MIIGDFASLKSTFECSEILKNEVGCNLRGKVLYDFYWQILGLTPLTQKN